MLMCAQLQQFSFLIVNSTLIKFSFFPLLKLYCVLCDCKIVRLVYFFDMLCMLFTGFLDNGVRSSTPPSGYVTSILSIHAFYPSFSIVKSRQSALVIS
jgi:hypothetical protein